MKKLSDWLPNRYTLFLLFLPVLLVFQKLQLDNDAWFLFTCGRYVKNYGIPFTEPFTFHENFHYLMQQWLFALGLYQIYETLGAVFVFFLTGLMFFLTYLFVYRICMMLSNNQFVSAIVTFMSEILAVSYIATRPLVFTVFLLAVTLYVMEKYHKTKKYGYLLIPPMLSVISINLQASMWLMLFLFMMPYLAEYTLLFLFQKEKCLKNALAVGISSLLVLLAGFINPYGLDAMTYVLRSYGVKSINNAIIEMHAPHLSDSYTLFLFIYLSLMVCFILWHKKGRASLRHIFLLLGVGYVGLSAVRSVPLLLLVLPLFLAYFAKDFVPKRMLHVSRFEHTLIGILVVATVIGCGLFLYTKKTNLELPEEYALLKDFSETFGEEKLSDVRMLIDFNHGGCAEYFGIPAYIDPRAEIFLKSNNGQKDIFDQYMDMRTGKIHINTVIDENCITHVYAPVDSMLYTYIMHDSDFRLLKKDEHGYIYENILWNQREVTK